MQIGWLCSRLSSDWPAGFPPFVTQSRGCRWLEMPGHPHGDPVNATYVHIWHCGQSSPNSAGASSVIQSLDGRNWLNVEAGHTEDGTSAQVGNCNGGANQRWPFL